MRAEKKKLHDKNGLFSFLGRLLRSGKCARYESWTGNKRGENVENTQLWPGLRGGNNKKRKVSSAHLKWRGSDRASPAACCWHNGGRSPADTPGRSNLHTEITRGCALGATATTTHPKLLGAVGQIRDIMDCEMLEPQRTHGDEERVEAMACFGKRLSAQRHSECLAAVCKWESQEKWIMLHHCLWSVRNEEKLESASPFLPAAQFLDKILPNKYHIE